MNDFATKLWPNTEADDRARSARILIVDDDPQCHHVVEAYLRQYGFTELLHTTEAEESLTLVLEREPDVVLLNLKLGGRRGFEILKEIREHPRAGGTPVIVLINGASETDKQRALDWGATDFLNKPLDRTALAARVRNALTIAVYQRAWTRRHEQIGQEVLQRRLAEVQSQSSVEKAEAANEAKTEFLAKFSHEVRTPMTAILGFTDLLLNDPALDGKFTAQRNSLLTIQRNGEYLLQVVQDVLEMSKIESRKLDIETTACSVIDLANDVAASMRVRAKVKGISFDVEFSGELPETIMTDPARVRQILISLIGNAVKFTDEGGVRLVVRFLGDRRKPKILFEIFDTGPGMTNAEIARVFQPFACLGQNANRRFGGQGLGLTISRGLARLLGGDISVESRPGVGSKFSATVATGPLQDVAMVAAPRRESDCDVDDEWSATAPKSIAANVLLAEDGPDNLRLIVFMLERAGVNVATAMNGRVAVEMALAARDEDRPFDLILMDMQMPILDGYEATRKLRAEGLETPIVALTAYALSKDRERCLAAGCDEYLSKPIDRDKLLATVQRYGRALVEG